MKDFSLIAAIALSWSISTAALASEEKFSQLGPSLALANDEIASVRAGTWTNAKGIWTPQKSQVLNAFDRLFSEEGKREIQASAVRGLDMSRSLKSVERSRFQVFGLTIGERQQLLFEASPADPYFDGLMPKNFWLEKIVSKSVFDGGFLYWSALYDMESGRFVASYRTPDQ